MTYSRLVEVCRYLLKPGALAATKSSTFSVFRIRLHRALAVMRVRIGRLTVASRIIGNHSERGRQLNQRRPLFQHGRVRTRMPPPASSQQTKSVICGSRARTHARNRLTATPIRTSTPAQGSPNVPRWNGNCSTVIRTPYRPILLGGAPH